MIKKKRRGLEVNLGYDSFFLPNTQLLSGSSTGASVCDIGNTRACENNLHTKGNRSRINSLFSTCLASSYNVLYNLSFDKGSKLLAFCSTQ